MAKNSKISPNIPEIFQGEISNEQFSAWLSQFEKDEQPLVELMTSQFKYFGTKQVSAEVISLYQNIATALGVEVIDLNATWFVPVGYVAKSGSLIAYMFRTRNDVPLDRFVSLADLSALRMNAKDSVVFIDDFLGSGAQAIDLWAHVAKQVRIPASCKFVIAIIAAYSAGIDVVSSNTKLGVVANHILSDESRALNSNGVFKQDQQQRQLAEQLVKKYGNKLYPDHPEGYKKSQSLIGFFYSTPNNTLPFYWSTAHDWKPLLPRSDSYRDPSFLIGPPPYLNRSEIEQSDQRPIIDLTAIDELAYEHDVFLAILSEFRVTSISLTFSRVMKELSVPAESIADILRLIRELSELKHEQSFVQSTLLIGWDASKMQLGDAKIMEFDNTTIKDFTEVSNAANQLSLVKGALAISKDGMLIGGYKLIGHVGVADPLVPRNLLRLAKISNSSNCLVVFFSQRSTVHFLYQGQRVLLKRDVSWHVQAREMKPAVDEWAREYNIEKKASERAIQLAFELANLGRGAIFTIGDHEKVLAFCEKPKLGSARWKKMNIVNDSIETVAALACQDGATIIAGNGEVVQGMTFIRPPAETVTALELGRGAKHSTAAKISKVTRAIAFAVSVDGRITAYADGVTKFKMMG